MKRDMLQYEKIYQILKNKIECGLLPGGARLPSRANLCKEFATSEKTVRRALKLLEEDGLVETTQRKRPTVAHGAVAGHKNVLETLQRADACAVDDILKTGILLCYPLNGHGMALCTGDEWAVPESIVGQMDPDKPTEFWRLSNRLWRYFISRNGNELALRAVDGLGFTNLDPLAGTREMRRNYQDNLRQLLRTVKSGGDPEGVRFDDLFVLYGFLSAPEENPTICRLPAGCPLALGPQGLERSLRQSQERYSTVYLDLLGLIAVGRYRPGDRLPSHEELRRVYNVSIDTTTRAIRILRGWGVVTGTRGKGIFVAMGPAELARLPLDPTLIAVHVRRFLDSLELLSLTVEGIADHAANQVRPGEARALYDKLEELWTEAYLYQLSPIVLLDFLTEHIRYDALRAIYKVLRENYHIGRSIPKLVNRKKTPVSAALHRQCLDAVGLLEQGETRAFARKAAEMFQTTHRLVIDECKRLGYWDAAMRVYDGTLLWK